MTDTNSQKIEEILNRGTEEVIDKDHLTRELRSGKKLRIKFGIDPTSSDLHLGHSILLRKLKQFQSLGHDVILLIGDFTATIGDPSGQSAQRKQLTVAEVKKNMKDYTKQAGKFLDLKKVKIEYNGKWYNKKGEAFLLDLFSKFTVTRLLERDDFQNRLKGGLDISMLELAYPLLQGYDSVELKVNVEIGGNDQKFNLLTGRKVQKRYDLPEQDIITVPLLEGTDGVRKMSKSYNNYIGVSEKPSQIYGKVMSIPDELMWRYFELVTEVPLKEIEKLKQENQKQIISPRDIKAKLSREIVKICYSEKEAQKAENEFNRIFREKELPTDLVKFRVNRPEVPILELLVETGLVLSKSEAKRLILQKGVKINGEIKLNWQEIVKINRGTIIQVGKKKFLKLI